MIKQHDVAELKAFARLHSRAQKLDESVLDFALHNIENDIHGDPRSWAYVLSSLAERAESSGDIQDSIQLYNLARFPYVGDPARKKALNKCQQLYRQWLANTLPDVEYWRFSDPDFGCYTAGLDKNKPVVVVLGGIVSIKEQWHRLLVMAKKLGYCVVLTELPGVGENTLPYDAHDSQLFRRILKRLQGRANTQDVHVIGFSFGGHLAMNASLENSNIHTITTVGAPIADFFGDGSNKLAIPDITYNTLAHIFDCDNTEVKSHISDWGLSAESLERISANIHYLASSRDEIIPLDDMQAVRSNVPHNQILQVDDIHGAPNHLPLTVIWIFSDLIAGSRINWLRGLTQRLLKRQVRKVGAKYYGSADTSLNHS
ncbi:Alpha/beta hydrolase family [Shewanella psychrophila]|uniref:Alpha/beta hydrolase family n=1 Tax=Shewanella psychrophila TaxID=225848 RepID=A0A1S6HIW4_9GAMM|nr:alpha/beta fold hydrolase [Shewanella psychrophila]AQS35434.1 Alpha/beta hydrolase family [Shewanella psychrophila]